ncbi:MULTISPECIES: methyltransferase [Variovorax]|jgi:methylase of polypeptide subunit release factors|uniref:methyltransferase n=1 Tax=Variovorax TaxID=34072 RepID=UPI00086F9A3A|nr:MULTISPECIES: class I SAM-dependent methyltransferase [Variovorax]MBN8752913.1 class I SAM-dependent methyltransferase [Variovorax sp.]ODU16826.1 MAG: SAM-dependent methyltransferase [Variovorax sp. SCN 67-85]ODV25730.1 MAG: SAM-dependent methyltransferase [Variovorax sp. SCN 67-20]OJZ15303.1 MAG: SAM-dependent methyltransferase [Variovorax sp. 67-131]UKI08049.1 class I SAM-dependent methyltransferase [Variovorax paradoxus]
MLNAAGVLRQVAATGYRFTTVTPLTHQRVLARRGREPGTTLRDVFGWNLPFEAGALPPGLLAEMEQAGIVRRNGSLLRSTVRIASLGDDLFFHSAYPTVEENAVFFGPDTSRFARFVGHALQERKPRGPGPLRVLDIGCGSGAGGIVAARSLADAGVASTVVMNDINPLALRYTSVNAEVAGVPVTLAQGDALSAVQGAFDLIISNPPYLDDAAQRAYRHGGARLGRALGARIAAESLKRLAPGGQLLLYTGVAMVDGEDPFIAELQPLLQASGCEWSYTEIDPDVFGEELERPVYAHIDRIAAVGLVASRAAEAAP